MQNVLLVKYGEIALRGKNRSLLENKLLKVVADRVQKVGKYWVTREQGRLLIKRQEEGKDFDYEKVVPIVCNIFGIIAVCEAVMLDESDIEVIKKNALIHMEKQWKNEEKTFKVETKRSDKKYPYKSFEVSSIIGGYIYENMKNLSVDVHNPEVTLTVEIRTNTYIYSKMTQGLGGLPVGMSGKALLLLSGGIDSPIAGFKMGKRGVGIDAIYFDSPPYTSDRAKQKVLDLAEKLSGYTGSVNLNIVPFTDIQLKLCECVPKEKMTIFLKRAMFKLAEKVALNTDCYGLITGDSIGQVASQTLKAMDAIGSAVTKIPIYRPLCSMDKQEIIDIAIDIGTFEISTRPYEDCCTIFVPKHPEINPKKSIIESIEKTIEGLDDMIDKAIENIKIVTFN